VSALLEAAADEDDVYLATGVQIAAGIESDTDAAWRSATSLPAIRPYAVADLNRRAGRDAQQDPLPGLEPLDCDAVVMASRDIVAGYAAGGCDGVAAAVRRAAAPGSEAVLFEQMTLPLRHRQSGAADRREAAPGQEDRESRAGGLGEGKLCQERLTGPLLADASRGGAAERSLSCGSAWSV
jgi:hypothetical protein